MTKRNLSLLYLVITLAIYSCYKIAQTIEDKDIQSNVISEVRDNTNFQNVVNAYYLGAIGLLNNSSILAIIKNRALSEDTDERISFSFLKDECAKQGVDLLTLMKNSIDVNGGTTEQKNLIESSINGFSENEKIVLPLIYFPYSENFSSMSIIDLAKGGKVMPTGTWNGARFISSSYSANTILTQSTAQNTPLLIITTGKSEIDDYPDMGLSSGSGGWLPWRRCYCSPPNKLDDGISSMGSCSRRRNASDRCLYVCSRTGLMDNAMEILAPPVFDNSLGVCSENCGWVMYNPTTPSHYFYFIVIDMKQAIRILLYLIFTLPNYGLTQQPVKLAVIDSFVFDTLKGYPITQGDTYSFYNCKTGDFSAYSKQTNQLLTSFIFDTLYDNKPFHDYYGDIAYRLKDRYMLIRSNDRRFDFFDSTGKFMYDKKIDFTFNKEKRYLNEENPPKNILVSADGSSFFLRVSNWPLKPKGDEYFKERQRKRQEMPGLIAQFNMNGEMINLFGQYDSIYLGEKVITDFDEYTGSVSSKDEIYLSFNLSDRIAVYSGGKLIRYVGTRGEFINKNLSDINCSQTKADWFLNKVTYNIETPYYFDCQIVNDRYIVRTYTTALKDTVRFTPQEQESKEKWVRGELNGCRIKTKNDEIQARLNRSKPCFVQIFDLQSGDKCLYDGPIDVRFPLCLGMRNENEFIFTSYLRPEKEQPQKQVLYYCKLIPSTEER